MAEHLTDIAFSPAVKATQERYGTRDHCQRVSESRPWGRVITEDFAKFIRMCDSFYFSTASADGRPYIQHRGGRPSFLRIMSEQVLAFADYDGNKQFISIGNLSENNKAAIFMMDYVNRQRVKLWGRAHVVDEDAELFEQLHDPTMRQPLTRAIVFRIEAWDTNCPKHITPRYPEAQVQQAIANLQAKIDALEAEVALLRGK